MINFNGMLELSNKIIPNNKRMDISVAIFWVFLFFGNLYFLNEAIAQSENLTAEDDKTQVVKNLGKEVPELKALFGDREIDLDPYMHVQNETITQIGIPNLFETQTNEQAQITMKHGEKISLKYGKQPLQMRAYLIDYDTDDANEIYPIKQIDYSTIMVPDDVPYGFKNLEIRCIYDNDEEITYTTSVNIEPQDVEEEPNDDN
ncbi:MAG: hypothetical protein ACE5SW_00545 [Nitrososphaeraceae archaeon]